MKKILFIVFLGSLHFGLMAQGGQLEDRIESQRAAFITQRLELTSVEAQRFWPVFNEYQDKLRALRRERRALKPVEQMSDAEAEAYIKSEMDIEERELQLKKQYIVKFKEVLPARKVALLNGAERQFRESLLKQVAQKRKEMRGKPKQ